MARINKPSLVIPALDHERVFAEDMGIATSRTIGRRTIDLATEKQQGGKPPVVTGSWVDGTAGQSLAEQLHTLGLINDDTELGSPEDVAIGFSVFQAAAALAAITPSTTDNVNYSDIYTNSLTITFGQWIVQVMAEASFTNSTGTVNNMRLTDGTNTLDSGTPTTTTTRERYAFAGGGVYGPGSYTFRLQYRVGTAGPTATARAPWMLMQWRRIA